MCDCNSWRNVSREKLIKTISLSVRTVVWRVEDIGSNINTQNIRQIISSIFPRLLMTRQMFLMLSCLFKESVQSLQSLKLHGTSIGENTFKEVARVLIQYNLKWNPLQCIILTDGGEKICGTEDLFAKCKTVRLQKTYSYSLYFSSPDTL